MCTYIFEKLLFLMMVKRVKFGINVKNNLKRDDNTFPLFEYVQ